MHSAANLLQAARSPLTPARAVGAILRWRMRLLGRTLAARNPRLWEALRLLPVLLSGSFRHPAFCSEGPGVDGLSFHRGWGALANAFGLPPPHRLQRHKRLIEGVLLVPGRGAATVLVLHRAESDADRQAVEERLAAAQALFHAGGARLDLVALGPREQPDAGPALRRAIAFGGLLAGAIPEAAVRAADAPEPLAAELAKDAPEPLAAIALLLLGREPAPSPVASAIEALQRGHSARSLARPEAFAVEWTARRSGAGPLLRATLRLIDEGGAPTGAMDLQAVRTLGERLTLALLHGVRRSALWKDRPLRQRFLGELLTAGIPRVLRPALLRRLPAHGEPEELRRVDGRFELVVGGVVVERGASEEQVRARYLALFAHEQSPPAHGPGPWDSIRARLARRGDRAGLLLSLSHASAPGAAPGAPFDPLNRGPARELGLSASLLLRFAPGRRPTARKLEPARAVELVLQAAARGAEVEIAGPTAEDQPAALRLTRLAAFVKAPGKLPLAIEAGGLVLELRAGNLRRQQMQRYLRRPRRVACDPEAPDLSLHPEQRQPVLAEDPAPPPAGTGRPPHLSARADHRQLVLCRIEVAGAGASFLWVNSSSVLLREEIPLGRVEAHLAEAQEILRTLSPACAIAVRASAEVEKAVRSTAQVATLARMVVGGLLPGPLILETSGRRFHTIAEGGWDSAAAQVSSLWPMGASGRLALHFSPGSFDAALPSSEVALLALYTRSVVLRRLGARLARFSNRSALA